MQPFRFIHASNLLLDHDFRFPRSPSDVLDSLTEDCTQAAFQQIVETALAENVDFLLLAGNSFDVSDHSLQSQLALVHGIEQLAEQGIPVFILPGESDPPQAWRAGIPLPDNAVVFLEPTDSPQFVERDGTVIASIQGIFGEGNHAQLSFSDSPFPIVVRYGKTSSRPAAAEHDKKTSAPEDHSDSDNPWNQPRPPEVSQQELTTSGVRYWALGTGDSRRTVYVRDAVAHHPGGPQGLHSRQTGPHGCTLVEVDGDGKPTLTFVPTAAIRWESLEVAVTRETSREELFQRFKDVVAEIHGHPTDAVYLLSWDIAGEGPLTELATEPDFCIEIDECLQAEFAESGIQLHSFLIETTDIHGAKKQSGTLGELEAEYLDQLSNPWHETPVDLESLLARSPLAGGPWQAYLQESAVEISEHLVFAEAMRRGHEWFSGSMEESA